MVCEFHMNDRCSTLIGNANLICSIVWSAGTATYIESFKHTYFSCSTNEIKWDSVML